MDGLFTKFQLFGLLTSCIKLQVVLLLTRCISFRWLDCSQGVLFQVAEFNPRYKVLCDRFMCLQFLGVLVVCKDLYNVMRINHV